MFHNHGDEGYRFSYPLIQYQVVDGHPAILCLGEGVEEIQQLFIQHKWDLEVYGQPVNMQIRDLHMDDKTMAIHEDQMFRYQISDWLAFTPERFREYVKIRDHEEKKAFLTRTLIGNTLSMAQGLGWNIGGRIEVDIEHFDDDHRRRMAGKKMIAVQARFRCNMELPSGIGLGKRPSLGFGVITMSND